MFSYNKKLLIAQHYQVTIIVFYDSKNNNADVDWILNDYDYEVTGSVTLYQRLPSEYFSMTIFFFADFSAADRFNFPPKSG